MVSWKWAANMLSANLALVVVSWSMYGWTMETGTALWSINMCQFVLNMNVKTVGPGIVKFPLLQESQRNHTDHLNTGSSYNFIANNGPGMSYFRIEGVEENGVKARFTVSKTSAAACDSQMVVPDLSNNAIYIWSSWGFVWIMMVPAGIMFWQSWKHLSPYPYNSVGYVVMSQDVPKLPLYKKAYKWMWGITITMFLGAFCAPPLAGAPTNLYQSSFLQLFAFYTMLKELYTPVTAAVPIGTTAWDILIPNMKFYQRASAILEEIEDGLLQLTVAKAKGKPEEGMAIFTKLGISAELAERIFAALEIRESITSPSKKVDAKKVTDIEMVEK